MSLQIQIPSRTATFRIYSSDGTLFYISSNFDYRILPNNTVQMKLNGNTKFQEKGSYYVILGPGFTKSSTKCGVESQAVMNSDQWKFTISKSRYFSIPMFKKCWYKISLRMLFGRGGRTGLPYYGNYHFVWARFRDFDQKAGGHSHG